MSIEAFLEKKLNEFAQLHPTLQQYTDKTITEMKTHPLQSLLIAGGIGFLLSRTFYKKTPCQKK